MRLMRCFHAIPICTSARNWEKQSPPVSVRCVGTWNMVATRRVVTADEASPGQRGWMRDLVAVNGCFIGLSLAFIFTRERLLFKSMASVGFHFYLKDANFFTYCYSSGVEFMAKSFEWSECCSFEQLWNASSQSVCYYLSRSVWVRVSLC